MATPLSIPTALVLLFVGATVSSASDIPGSKMSGRDIMSRVRANQIPADETSTIKMTLTRPDGSARERALALNTLRDGDTTWILLRLTSPASIRGTGFLSRSEPDTEDQRWLYLPAVRRSRRIPTSDKNKPFVGSEFTYEDLDVIDLDAWHYTARGDSGGIVVVEATPAGASANSGSGYGRIVYHVDVQRSIVPRVDYFDPQGRNVKVREAEEPLKVGPVWRFSRMRMRDVGSGRITILEFSGIQIETGLEPNLFSVRSLERGT